MVEKSVKRIYLSGPITCIGHSRAREIFGTAKKDLERRGFEVVSPFDNGLPENAGYEEHMRKDLEMLAECDTVCLLPGWWMSRGAMREKERAEALDKTLITYRNLRRRLK